MESKRFECLSNEEFLVGFESYTKDNLLSYLNSFVFMATFFSWICFRFTSCSISSLVHFRIFQNMIIFVFTLKRQQKNTFLFTTVKCLSVKSEINSGSIFAVNWCSFNEFIFNAFSILSRPCSCGFSSTKLTFQQSSKQTFQWIDASSLSAIYTAAVFFSREMLLNKSSLDGKEIAISSRST